MPSRLLPDAAGAILLVLAGLAGPAQPAGAPAAPSSPSSGAAARNAPPAPASATPPRTAPSPAPGAGAIPRVELPAGTLLVVNKSADTLAFLDAATLQVSGTVPTGHAPHEVAVDPAGAFAYVSNYGTAEQPGHTLTVVDVTARRAVATIDLAPLQRPHGILVASDGTVWVTCEGSQAVASIDPRTRKVSATIPTGQKVTHMLAITPDGTRLYAANIESNTVSRIDIATKTVTHIAVGQGPEGMDIAPDGREVWVAHRGDGGISILDAGTGAVKETIPAVCAMPIRVKFTPQGGLALVSCARSNEVAVLATAGMKGRTVVRRVPTGEMPVGVLVVPGGGHAFVASTQADRVMVMDLQTGEMVRSLAPGDEPDGMAWAPAPAAAASPSSPR